MDLVAHTPRLPMPGETLTGHSFITVPGGKGANQAVAVARLGVPAQMVGRVGGDGFGQELLNSLRIAGVGSDRILVDSTTRSGIAVIAVDDNGENHIILVPGANGRVGIEDVNRLRDLLPTATILLLQLEIPMAAIVAAAQIAKQSGVKVILDPAPAQELPTALYPLIDILTPNQVEASQLAGFAVHDLESAAQATMVFQQRGVHTVIIKLGRQGAFCATQEEHYLIPPFSVEAIDTVAAGDAFNGGLAAALAEGVSLKQAGVWASATGALSVTRSGAQASMPTRDELNALLALSKQTAEDTSP